MKNRKDNHRLDDFLFEEKNEENKVSQLNQLALKEKIKISEIYQSGNISDNERKLIKEHELNIKQYENMVKVLEKDQTHVSDNGNASLINKSLEEKKIKLTQITKDTDISEIMEDLKVGVKELMTSDRYKKFLDFRASLYQYSYNNCLLIEMQKPGSSFVGSFNFWKENNRYVNKGETSIKILAPVTTRKMVDVPVMGEKNNPVRDKDGKVITEKKERTVVSGFKLASVFDISQTSGEPIPNILKQLTGNSSTAEKLIETIKSISAVPITFEKITDGSKGYFSPKENKIVIKDGMSKDQTAKTIIHEYTHSKLHTDLKNYINNKAESEIQAESTAYVVSKHFGLDTSEYSFGYITGWAAGKELEQLQDTMKVVSDTAKNIIGEIEGKLTLEYELMETKSKDSIKKMIKEEGFIPTDRVVDNIHKLNKITGQHHTLNEICNYYKNPASFKGGNEEKEFINKIGTELKNQEMSQQKKTDKFIDLEPSPSIG